MIFGVDILWGKLFVKYCEGIKLVFVYIYDFENVFKKINYDLEVEKVIVFKGYVDIGVDLMLVVEYLYIVDIFSWCGFLLIFEDLFFKSKCYIVVKVCYIEYGVNGKCWFILFFVMECDLVYDMDLYYK